MSRKTESNVTPERQEPKTARATEAPPAGPGQDRKQNAQPGPQSQEKASGRRNEMKGEAEATPERTAERRSPERADETGKQRFEQQAPK